VKMETTCFCKTLVSTYDLVALGGQVVIVLATGPKFRRFKLGRGQWIFNGEVKPSAPCRKSLRRVKEPTSMKDILRRQNSLPFLAKFLLLGYQESVLVTARERWWMN
jgi:hypothetical protein